VIEDYYGDTYENVKLEYSIENEPLGTGGGIAKALQLVESETCLILNGDTYFDVNYEELWQVHSESGKLMTLALKYMENPDRYGTVLLEGSDIVKFQEKQVGLPFGIINGGIYWVNKALLEEMPTQEKFSFESEVLEKKVTQNKLGGYISQGLFIDIGIPEDYARAQEIFAK
jgi:D-glycero-alpha-D-manno-heptose 1-phosphate guanylyltransferase